MCPAANSAGVRTSSTKNVRLLLQEHERGRRLDGPVGRAAQDDVAWRGLASGDVGQVHARDGKAALELRAALVLLSAYRTHLRQLALRGTEPLRQLPHHDGQGREGKPLQDAEHVEHLSVDSVHAPCASVDMRAILVREPGDESVLALGDAPAPVLGPSDVRIRIRATALNRADLMQRQGLYPPPPGVTPILGMECAGEVVEVGPEVHDFHVGQRVMALLPGGGYAEEACVDHGSVLAVPDGMSDEEAGAFPEVFFTAFSNLFMPGLGALAAGESALVHGGGGGVGTAAIMLLREAGNRCIVTVGSPEKARDASSSAPATRSTTTRRTSPRACMRSPVTTAST